MTRTRLVVILVALAFIACEDRAPANTPSRGRTAAMAPPVSIVSPAAQQTPAPVANAPNAVSTAPVGSATNAQTSLAPVQMPMAALSSAGTASQRPQLDPRTPFAQLPPECRGFDLVGLKYSPGGSVLPNVCAPFEGTYNNPYAVRCQDADPSYHTQWLGDQYCILPPPPELGIQLRAGPKSYDNASDYQAFVLDPGAELNTTYNVKSSNAEPHKFYRANYRMRDGSHHLIMRFTDENLPDGWSAQALNAFSIGELVGNPSIQGSQRPSDDRPSGMLDAPPENRGLASDLAAHQQVSMNLHHMNRFDHPILREAWVNLWYMPPEEVKSTVLGMFLRGDPQDVMIAPGEHRILHYSTSITGPLRVVALWGHRHVSTDRFSAWLQRANGEMLHLYESFSWADQPIYQYDSISKNPLSDVPNHGDGGYSGLVEMKQGDRLHFLCDVTNRQDVTLKFANELNTGEMCILWGNRVGDGDFNTPEHARDTVTP